ncbi:unnamed protein product [Camellia sinensis]
MRKDKHKQDEHHDGDRGLFSHLAHGASVYPPGQHPPPGGYPPQATQMKELGAQSNATNEEIITQVLGPERPGHVRTYGLGPSTTDIFGE